MKQLPTQLRFAFFPFKEAELTLSHYIAVFVANISNHVAASEHDPILNFIVLQVNYLVKKKCSTSGACELSRDEF